VKIKEYIMLNIGETAPDFALPNQDGKTIRLSDYRGKKVIIFAFPQANTPGCTAQACSFRDEMPDFEAGNAVVLGISHDAQPALKSWKQSRNLPYDLLSDTNHKVLEQWGAWGMPMLGLITLPRAIRSYWVIDEAGKLVDMQIGVGPKESVEKALKAVNQTARV
jgi:thioredoxin-dependent peroxiredoxin